MVRIENWSVLSNAGIDGVTDGQQVRWLHGFVHGHPSFVDGHEVTTSVIIGGSTRTEDGHVVQTRSRQYLLGAPSKSYIAWLEQHGIAFDSEQPIGSE